MNFPTPKTTPPGPWERRLDAFFLPGRGGIYALFFWLIGVAFQKVSVALDPTYPNDWYPTTAIAIGCLAWISLTVIHAIDHYYPERES